MSQRERFEGILEPHREVLATSTARKWSEYAKERNLPSAQILIRAFGSWNDIKQWADQNTKIDRRPRYNNKEIKDILKKHKERFTSQVEWNAYAKEQQLPYYAYIVKQLTSIELYEITGYVQVVDRSILQKVAKDHKEHLTSTRKWDAFARNHHLPSSFAFIRTFGSWSKAKSEVLKGGL